GVPRLPGSRHQDSTRGLRHGRAGQDDETIPVPARRPQNRILRYMPRPVARPEWKLPGMTEQTHGFIELFAAKAKRYPENVFARFGERTIRFSEIMRDASTLAAHLRQLGIGQGDRVAVMMDNSPAS